MSLAQQDYHSENTQKLSAGLGRDDNHIDGLCITKLESTEFQPVSQP